VIWAIHASCGSRLLHNYISYDESVLPGPPGSYFIRANGHPFLLQSFAASHSCTSTYGIGLIQAAMGRSPWAIGSIWNHSPHKPRGLAVVGRRDGGKFPVAVLFDYYQPAPRAHDPPRKCCLFVYLGHRRHSWIFAGQMNRHLGPVMGRGRPMIIGLSHPHGLIRRRAAATCGSLGGHALVRRAGMALRVGTLARVAAIRAPHRGP